MLLGFQMPPAIVSAYGLSMERNLSTPEIHSPNDFYGHAHQLKLYAELPLDLPLPFTIEHGPMLPEQPVWEADLNSPHAFLATPSWERALVVNDRSPKWSWALGPMIHYAKDALDPKDCAQERSRLGRNLLFFPIHPTHDISVEFNQRSLFDQLHSLKAHFDTIRICLYWIDIINGNGQAYIDRGYEVVSAGHIYDADFMPRLKSLIKMASMTASNYTGTSAYYSYYMGVPFYLLEGVFSRSGTTDFGQKYLQTHRSGFNYRDQFRIELIGKYPELREFNFGISSGEYQLAEEMCGLNQVKTPSEIRNWVSLVGLLNRSEVTKLARSIKDRVKGYLATPSERKADIMKALTTMILDQDSPGVVASNEALFMVEKQKEIIAGSFGEVLKVVQKTLSKHPRRVPGKLVIEGRVCYYADLHSFYHQAVQIFGQRLYDFRTSNCRPTIVDCGAHIGLASLFFATRFPESTIYAFEADPGISRLLQANVEAYGMSQVTVETKAVWVHDRGVSFSATGDDSGFVRESGQVQTGSCRLRDFLQGKSVDLLKMDIEGAEFEVLEDCDGVLSHVQNLVVEVHRFQENENRLAMILTILERNEFDFTLADLHAAEWLDTKTETPFTACKTGNYVVTVFAWKREVRPKGERPLNCLDRMSRVVNLLNTNQHEEALRVLDEIVVENNESCGIGYCRAISLARLKRFEQAKKVLESVVAREPAFLKAKMLLREIEANGMKAI